MYCNFFSLVCLMIFLLQIPVSLFAEDRMIITFFPKPVVPGETIFLGDIAKITGKNKEWIEAAKSIKIGRSPSFGKTRKISTDGITDHIRDSLSRQGVDLASVNLAFLKEIYVTRNYLEISQDRIKEIFIRYIKAHLTQDESRVVIKNIHSPGRIILPPGKVTYQVIAPDGTDFIDRVGLIILFSIDNTPRKKIMVTGLVEIYQDVVCTGHFLKKHHLIKEGDIRIERRSSKYLPRDVIFKPEEVIGKRTRRAIKINKPLRSNFLEMPPLVKRGDMVTILAESGNFLIKTLGEVQEKGSRGKVVRVVNISSRKGIYARVINSNTVRVEF